MFILRPYDSRIRTLGDFLFPAQVSPPPGSPPARYRRTPPRVALAFAMGPTISQARSARAPQCPSPFSLWTARGWRRTPGTRLAADCPISRVFTIRWPLHHLLQQSLSCARGTEELSGTSPQFDDVATYFLLRVVLGGKKEASGGQIDNTEQERTCRREQESSSFEVFRCSSPVPK